MRGTLRTQDVAERQIPYGGNVTFFDAISSRHSTAVTMAKGHEVLEHSAAVAFGRRMMSPFGRAEAHQ